MLEPQGLTHAHLKRQTLHHFALTSSYVYRDGLSPAFTEIHGKPHIGAVTAL